MPSNAKELINNWRHFTLDALLIVGLALFLRVHNLLSMPIFVDEAIYLRWAQVMKAEPSLRFLPLTDGKQPLFMWVVMPFLKVFEDPLIAGRMVSACSGMASVIGVFLITLELFKNKKTALVASLFYVVSPFTVFFDRLSLVDSMLSMFGIWTLYFAVLAAKRLRLDFAMIAGFFLGFAWLTKSPAIFFLSLLPTTILFVPNIKKNIWRFILYTAAAAIIGYGMYNILRLGPSFHLISTRNQDYLFTLSEVLNDPLIQFTRHGEKTIEWLVLLLPFPIILLSTWAIIKGFKKYSKQFLFLGLWFLVPLIAQIEFGKVITARYLLFTMIPLFIISAVCIVQIIKFKFSHYLIALLILILPALVMDYYLLTNPQKAFLPSEERQGFLETWTSGYGISEVAKFIKQKHKENPDAHIVVGTEGAFGTLPDGLQIYVEDLPNTTVFGVGNSDIQELSQSLINAKIAGDQVYLVVNKSRLWVDPKELGLNLIQEFPKAVKKDGTQDKLQLFEVGKDAIDIYNLKHAPNNKIRPS